MRWDTTTEWDSPHVESWQLEKSTAWRQARTTAGGIESQMKYMELAGVDLLDGCVGRDLPVVAWVLWVKSPFRHVLNWKSCDLCAVGPNWKQRKAARAFHRDDIRVFPETSRRSFPLENARSRIRIGKRSRSEVSRCLNRKHAKSCSFPPLKSFHGKKKNFTAFDLCKNRRVWSTWTCFDWRDVLIDFRQRKVTTFPPSAVYDRQP